MKRIAAARADAGDETRGTAAASDPHEGGFPMRRLNTRALVSWACQLIAAAILLQTLFFKFTAAPESVYIFSTLGLEPWGRIGSGVVELLAAVLLVVPRPRRSAR